MKCDLIHGDALTELRKLPDESVQCVVTSPPYWGLRDYGIDSQLGLEATPEEYVANMVEVFREVRRVLRSDGTLWLNLGDSYAGSNQAAGTANPTAKQKSNTGTNFMFRKEHKSLLSQINGLKPKDLVGIPWRLAFALQADGWWLRQDIIWSKPNPMPESVTDRCTKSHEYIFLLTKAARYYYDADAIREEGARYGWNAPQFKCGDITRHHGNPNGGGGSPIDSEAGRNKRSVWTIATEPYPEAHFATFPTKLVEPCILAGSKEGDTVLDPFCGSCTVGYVALRAGRAFIGIDLKAQYLDMAKRRIALPLFIS